MLGTIAAIAAGGAIGAVLRHGANVLAFRVAGDAFPWGTLGVNVIGSFVMGVLIVIFAHNWQPPQEMRALIVTGLLGAFTTFSTFSLDVATLWERGSLWPAALYIMASVVLSIGALFLAMALTRAAVT